MLHEFTFYYTFFMDDFYTVAFSLLQRVRVFFYRKLGFVWIEFSLLFYFIGKIGLFDNYKKIYKNILSLSP